MSDTVSQNEPVCRCERIITPLDQPAAPDWAWAFSQSPAALAELVRGRRARLWVERFVRGLDDRLGHTLGLPPCHRPAAQAVWMPNHLVPIVGALPSQAGGVGGGLGVMELFSIDPHTQPARIPPEQAQVDNPVAAARAGLALVCATLIEVMPRANAIDVRLHMAQPGAGSSVSFPAGIGALLRILGCAWPADLVATGGIDVRSGRFLSAVRDTIEAKARTAAAFGYKRLAVVIDDDDAPLPEVIGGLRVIPLPAHPVALLMALAQLDGVDFHEEQLVCALALYDLRIARQGAHMIEQVIEETEPYVSCGAPIVEHIAWDMRSRMLLHAGRSDEARAAMEEADKRNGMGWRPEGRLGEVLRYQRVAHRSIVHLDLGEWNDDLRCHGEVDALIAELDARWPTRHERLMRLFLANSRARRHEFLGRLHGDAARFDAAWSDLTCDQSEWTPLLDTYAREQLQLSDTTSARVENQLVDLAASRLARGVSLPEQWRTLIASRNMTRSALARNDDSAVLVFDGPSGELAIGGDGFDACAGLQLHAVLGKGGLPDELAPLQDAISCRLTPSAAAGLPFPWFVWLERVALALASQGGQSFTLPNQAWSGLLGCDSNSIMRILALRSAHTLATLGEGANELFALAPPDPRTPLRALFDDLASQEKLVLQRAPY